MAFATKIGNILKTTVNKNIKMELSASHPSIYQAIRFMSSSKVFIGGLSYGMDETSLKDACTKYGEVVDARIITDYETGRSRGFGFVTFTSSEDASAAISGMDGKEFQGRIVRVDFAHDRTGGFRDSYGGRGGSSYGGGGGGYGGSGGSYGGGGGNYSAGGDSYGSSGGVGYSRGSGGYGGDSYGSNGGGSYAPGDSSYGGGGNYGGDGYGGSGGGGYSRGSGGYGSGGGDSYVTGDGTYSGSGNSDGGGSTGGSGTENYYINGGSNDIHVSGAISDNYASGSSGSGYGGVGGLDHGDNQGSIGTSGYNQGDPMDGNYKEADVDEPDDYADKRA